MPTTDGKVAKACALTVAVGPPVVPACPSAVILFTVTKDIEPSALVALTPSKLASEPTLPKSAKGA